MSLVLYRKYRPRVFSEIIGQKHVVQTLQNEIRQEKLAHAYLFSGPRGIGKTTVARILAKVINCERVQGEKDFRKMAEPCNACSICQEFNSGRNLDLIEIDAASNRGIDDVRALRERVRFPPSRNKYKVFIIDEVHMLTPEAFNALLKTLEEPPSYIIFILATTELHKVPETIISRCQRFDFTKVDFDQIINRLEWITRAEKIKIALEVLQIITQRSEGCVRDAESLLFQVMALDEKEITLEQASIVIPSTQINLIYEFVKFILQKNQKAAIEKINQLMEEGIDLEQFAKDLIEFLRKVLLIKVGTDEKRVFWQLDGFGKDKIQELAQMVDLKKLVVVIEEFIRAQQNLSYAEVPQLPLELAVIKVCE